MARLLLVKHALPEIRPDVPSKRWLLGEQGRAQSLLLAERLRPHHLEIVITSEEPKAAETGKIVADVLGLLRRTAPGLHELDRAGEPYFDHPNDYGAAVKAFFESPTQKVFGHECADESQRRFVKAVKEALASYPEENVVLTAHGIVNTLFVAAHNDVEPFTFWQAWALGTFAVLSRPDFVLLEAPADHEEVG